MEVIVAKTAGFCFGVERAVSTVYQALKEKNVPLYTYGPIIHNEEVVKELSDKGVRIYEPGMQAEKGAVIIIRSHGISCGEEEMLRREGFEVLDATCPFVKKIHRTVRKAGQDGRFVLIVGDAEHPEVRGICGWCTGPHAVIGDFEDFSRVSTQLPLTIVSQTTFHQKKFQEIVEKISLSGYDTDVVNTICNATQMRQSEAVSISSSVGTMIVIGGIHSSNTRKLYEICKANCSRTFYIQTLEDLVTQGFAPRGSVGITAGASTPKKIIEEVQTYVRSEF